METLRRQEVAARLQVTALTACKTRESQRLFITGRKLKRYKV